MRVVLVAAVGVGGLVQDELAAVGGEDLGFHVDMRPGHVGSGRELENLNSCGGIRIKQIGARLQGFFQI
jgi:hypothetical protein